jgi:uncharacterized OB-fold protein
MSAGVIYYVCRSCSLAVFPSRALCPRCGGAGWLRRAATSAILEDVTTLHHARGRQLDSSIRLGTVRLDSGPAVVVRLEKKLSPGTRVVLETIGGAPQAVEAT